MEFFSKTPAAPIDGEGAENALEILHSLGNLDAQNVNLEAIMSHPLSLAEAAPELTSAQKWFVLKRLNYDGLVSLDDLPLGAAFMLEKVEHLSPEESVRILQDTLKDFKDDPNIPNDDYELYGALVAESALNSGHVSDFKEKLNPTKDMNHEIHSLSEPDLSLEGCEVESTHEIVDWDLQVRLEAAIVAFHSPYPEVRAVCDPFDDPTVSCETIRVYIVGLVWLAIGTFIGVFFNDRQPSISLSTSIVQLFIYPSGMLLAKILPKWSVTVFGTKLDLNPGPWSYKEQMLTTLFYSIAGGLAAYVTSNITAQKLPRFYDNDWVTFGYQTLLILSTNFLGFGFAGIMRRVSVYPVRAVWPTVLPQLAINQALMRHDKKENINGWTISRYNFLFLVTGSSFIYYWIPGYLFQALSTFNWISWIKPDNFNLATITGSVSGLGVNPITTFDWNIIDSNSPLVLPFYNQVNNYAGIVLAFFCIVGLYYSNYKWTKFLPINSQALYNNLGEPYSVRSILNEKSLFDNDKYQVVGPPFYTAANLVSYGAFFAVYPFVICYQGATDYKFVWSSIRKMVTGIINIHKSTYDEFDDPHSRMMAKYKEVPEWCFCVILVMSIVFSILCVKLYPMLTAVWTIFFAIGISFIFYIPFTIIMSVTGFLLEVNVLVEIMFGYMVPGNPMALMFVKALATNIDIQAQNYVSNQKIAHYAKIAPRSIFRCQILAVFVSSFINLGVLNFVLTHIKDYCSIHNRQKFTCPQSNAFFTSSVIWGVIGPEKVFSHLYPQLKWCFLIGFLISFPCIAIKWYLPRRFQRYFQPVIIIGGFLVMPPYNLAYYTPGMVVSWFSMIHLKKRYTAFWEKYNYVFSGAMGAGIAFASVIIFFAVQYHDKSIDWWGNDVMYAGLDGAGAAALNVTLDAPDGYFGPRIGHFP